MKVAITGGTGLLGKALIPLINAEGWKPIILSRNAYPEDNVRQTDYSKTDLIEKLSDCQMVVHLAANRGPKSEISAFHPDEILTQNLYEVCLIHNIKNIVYASSISVYSNQETLPWNESVAIAPISMYGISKYTNELLGNYYHQKHHLSIKNLRFAHLFGANEKNNYLVNLFMRLAYNHEVLTLHTQSTAKREFLYVKDAAKAIIKALKHTKSAGSFNVGSQLILTNYEVAEMINEVFENPYDIHIQNPEASDETASSYMTHDLAKKEIKFQAKYEFKQALTEIKQEMDEMKHVPKFF